VGGSGRERESFGYCAGKESSVSRAILWKYSSNGGDIFHVLHELEPVPDATGRIRGQRCHFPERQQGIE
jgi:hypothetical protein